MRGFACLMVAASGFAPAAPIPKDTKPKPDAEAIQGTWQVVKFEGDDQPPPEEMAKLRLVFQGEMVTVQKGDGEGDKAVPFKIDPTAKPKTLDLRPNGDRSEPGIYELDGDTLRICLAEGNGATRPTEMKAVGKRVALVTLKRVKDEKKDK